jgi:hypothetical protein
MSVTLSLQSINIEKELLAVVVKMLVYAVSVRRKQTEIPLI